MKRKREDKEVETQKEEEEEEERNPKKRKVELKEAKEKDKLKEAKENVHKFYSDNLVDRPLKIQRLSIYRLPKFEKINLFEHFKGHDCKFDSFETKCFKKFIKESLGYVISKCINNNGCVSLDGIKSTISALHQQGYFI